MLGTRTSPSAQRASAGSGVSKEMSLQLKFALRAHCGRGRAPSKMPLISDAEDFLGKATLWRKLKIALWCGAQDNILRHRVLASLQLHSFQHQQTNRDDCQRVHHWMNVSAAT